MKFVEKFISDSGPVPKFENRGSPALASEYAGSSQIVVNLLPAHPYQYPQHQLIRSILSGESIDKVIQEYGIGKLTFVVNKNIKKEYRPSFDGGRCEVCFDDPEYPFLPERTAHLNGDYKLLDWFQFIILARASRGEAMEEVPVSVTSFSKDKKPEGKRFMSGIPVSVKELAEMAGASTENHILVDHPFSGVVLDPGTRFDRLKPIEILVFPKNTTKSESFLNRFFCKFRTSYRRFEGLYETTDIYRNRACRKCLRCVTICPAKIQPFLLSAIADRGSLKDAVELNVADCIECGLCSCACPSGIPLMKNIVMLKKEL